MYSVSLTSNFWCLGLASSLFYHLVCSLLLVRTGLYSGCAPHPTPSTLWSSSRVLVNHYPPSTESTPTVSLQKHSDFCGLTILMQNLAGFQFNNDGEWVWAELIADANVVYLGDQIEILTNGLYKSPEHRAMANPAERFSIGCFAGPPDAKVVGPIPELLSESRPIRYKTRTYAQFRTEIMTIPFMAKTLTADA